MKDGLSGGPLGPGKLPEELNEIGGSVGGAEVDRGVCIQVEGLFPF